MAADARVALHLMHTRAMSDDDWARLARRSGDLGHAPLALQQFPGTKALLDTLLGWPPRGTQPLKVLVIDDLAADAEQSMAFRGLLTFARGQNVAVIVVAEEEAQDPARQRREIEQLADVVVCLHRDDQADRESPRAGEADLAVSRHRHGPTMAMILHFQGHYARFVDPP